MAECGGCASARSRCGKGQEKIFPATAVRYGKMGYIGEFAHDPDLAFTCGGKVIIQTDRGIEIGEQVSLTCFGCKNSVTREAMRAYAKASGSDSYRFNNGRILRDATPGDLDEQRHLDHEIKDKLALCRRLSEQDNLAMEIVDAEHVFGGERIIFYFMAEDRIDFRELVRQLAREFQTRIEMRQVGARDEARLLADYETCGRECCCKNFLKVLKPVGMQMAKLQKATLDPSKVSGRCGRLKCCLRYEHDTYTDLNKRLPRLGKRVRTASEEGVIFDRQVLTQLLKIHKDDGTISVISLEDIVDRDVPPPVNLPSDQQNSDQGFNNNRRDQRRPPGPQPMARAKPAPSQPEPLDDPDPMGMGDWEQSDDISEPSNSIVEAQGNLDKPDNKTVGRSEIAPPPPSQGGPASPRPQSQPRGDGQRRGRRRRRRDNKGRPRSPDSPGPVN